MNELVRCARALVGGELRENFAFAVRDGVIAASGDYQQLKAQAAELNVRSFPADRLIVPGFINGHSHAYQVLLRGWADDLPFEEWRSQALYRIVPRLTPDDVYWVFIKAFSEMLSAGITTVAEFFYLNGAGNAHAEAAIRAAGQAGIRLVFARAWMDAESAPEAFRERCDQAEERTAELRARFPHANVCVAPHSLHATSLEMMRSAAEFASSQKCAMHVHVAESANEGERMVAEHGATPVTLLDRIGALNDRTVAIHAIFLSEAEKELLGRSGARVVHNPITNQYLGDGVCDIARLHALGVPIGLGTDADVQPSLIGEMRAAALLQKLMLRDGAALDARTAYAFGTGEGARVLGIGAGDLVAGNAADYIVLDARHIDPWSPPLNALVYRGENAWVQATVVGGRRVYTGEASPLARQARQAVARIARRVLEQ